MPHGTDDMVIFKIDEEPEQDAPERGEPQGLPPFKQRSASKDRKDVYEGQGAFNAPGVVDEPGGEEEIGGKLESAELVEAIHPGEENGVEYTQGKGQAQEEKEGTRRVRGRLLHLNDGRRPEEENRHQQADAYEPFQPLLPACPYDPSFLAFPHPFSRRQET